MDLDLNIENYNAKDLYRLFQLDIAEPLDETCMKKAKRIVLSTHPDKSNLPTKYFLFFSAAYKLLFSVYEIATKKKQQPLNYDAQFLKKEEFSPLSNHNHRNKDSQKPFSQWFHQTFEKDYVPDEDDAKGYQDWLQSSSNVSVNPTIVADIDEYKQQVFAGSKAACRSSVIATSNHILEMEHLFSGSSCGGKKITDHSLVPSTTLGSQNTSSVVTHGMFNADMFSSFTYTDLKQAYEESVFPVTEQDYDRIPKFASVDEYLQKRKLDDRQFQQSFQQTLQNKQNGNATSVIAIGGDSATLMNLLQEIHF